MSRGELDDIVHAAERYVDLCEWGQQISMEGEIARLQYEEAWATHNSPRGILHPNIWTTGINAVLGSVATVGKISALLPLGFGYKVNLALKTRNPHISVEYAERLIDGNL